METGDKTKEELLKELQELRKTYNSLKATIEKEHVIKKDEDYVLKKLIHAAEEFIQFTADTPDYKKILRVIIDISGAKYAALNIFDENGLDFTTVALEGVKENIQKGMEILGFGFKNKHWKHDPIRAEKTKNVITRFMHLNELTGRVIPKNVIYLIDKTFHIEETFVVKIVKDEKVLGDFTLLFEKGRTLINSSYVELYANQVGLFLERHKLTNFLSGSEKKYRMLVENLNEIIYTLDKKGKITYLSSNFEAIFGYAYAEVVGKSFTEFMGSNELKNQNRQFVRVIKGVVLLSEYRFLTKDGRTLWLRTSAKPIKKGGHVTGVQGVLTDITDLKESEAKLQKLNADKDRFISILSHDLKSQFNALLGLSELLTQNIREYDTNKIEFFASHINKAARNTYNLLEDLLKWASAQQGSIPFNPQSLNIAEIWEDIFTEISQNADAKSISINYSATKLINVIADADAIKTVLRNLVSNAIKFTNNGGAINITAVQTESEVKISVSDNGIGMGPDKLAKLFNISEDITTKGTAQESGTGLGLLLCKEFVEKHGGEIWVESKKGKGSVFHFTIPGNTDDGLRILQ